MKLNSCHYLPQTSHKQFADLQKFVDQKVKTTSGEFWGR